MNDISKLSTTIEPKSDQLNADDMIAAPMTVKITGVRAGDKDQPVIIDIEGHRPYKPCKSMRRVMVAAWGENGHNWVGKSMTLYNDPTVKWGGVAVGGIRISHMSDIKQKTSMMLTSTRGKRAQYTVEPLVIAAPAMYPADKFAEALPAMRQMIADGKMTPEQVIAHCRKTGELTAEQIAQINEPQPEAPAADAEAQF